MVLDQDLPPGWPKPPGAARRLSATVLFGLFGVLCLVITAAGIDTREFRQAAVFGIGAIGFAHLAGMSLSLLRRQGPAVTKPAADVTDQGERGLAFRYAKQPYYWLTSVLVLVALLLAALGYGFARGDTPVGWVLAAVAVVGVLFLAWFVITYLRLAPGVVVVTPSGVYHRSLAFEHFVPWEAVLDVQAREGPNPRILVKALHATATRERRYTGPLGPGAEDLPSMSIRTYWLGANAVPTYLALKRYFKNPAERQALGLLD